jgi:hypothetical protein
MRFGLHPPEKRTSPCHRTILYAFPRFLRGVGAVGFPRGTKTKSSASGTFKQVSLNRGRPMAMASQDS